MRREDTKSGRVERKGREKRDERTEKSRGVLAAVKTKTKTEKSQKKSKEEVYNKKYEQVQDQPSLLSSREPRKKSHGVQQRSRPKSDSPESSSSVHIGSDVVEGRDGRDGDLVVEGRKLHVEVERRGGRSSRGGRDGGSSRSDREMVSGVGRLGRRDGWAEGSVVGVDLGSSGRTGGKEGRREATRVSPASKTKNQRSRGDKGRSG